MRPSRLRQVRETFAGWSRRLPRPFAVALDQISDDPEEAGRIRGAQISAIVRLTPLVIAASCLNAAIMVATFAATGSLRWFHWAWAVVLFAAAANFMRAWWKPQNRTRRSASRRAVRRVVMHGAMFGALWGFIPAVTFAGAPVGAQLFLACLTAGMMSAGGYVLATVPLAGMCYVLLVAGGAMVALLQDISAVNLGIIALLASYTAVIAANINWSAALFVESHLAEAQVRREVAAREAAQALAVRAERMTALGELAGGIAHDFNNLLQVVSGGASRIERRPDDVAEVVRQAGRIQDAVDLGSTISRRLLAFARRDALSAEPIEAGPLLADLGEMLAHAIGASIAVRIDAGAASGRFLADRGQLTTVLLNLATNARDAMPNGGTLTVSADSVVVEADSEDPRLAAGRYMRLRVADTGGGIDPAILARVAEPFFTTKPKGRGTGLGLSMAKGFAEQSGGALAIASEPGRGATVTLWLPQADPGRSETPMLGPLIDAGLGGGRRVLVVDDDDLVREGLRAALEDAGFLTFGAASASSAIAHFDEGAFVEAIVTDFDMPGMNGADLLRAVHARRPDLPAVLFTGHVSEMVTQAMPGLETGRLALLQKPLRPARVAERLAALMALRMATESRGPDLGG